MEKNLFKKVLSGKGLEIYVREESCTTLIKLPWVKVTVIINGFDITKLKNWDDCPGLNFNIKSDKYEVGKSNGGNIVYVIQYNPNGEYVVKYENRGGSKNHANFISRKDVNPNHLHILTPRSHGGGDWLEIWCGKESDYIRTDEAQITEEIDNVL